MKRYLSRILLVALVAGGVAACRMAPVMNVEDTQFLSEAPSMEAAEQTIKLAGAGLGWQMKTIAPGHIVASLPLRSHLAVTDIMFDRDSYSIRYKDSSNLKYDGNQIHSNYNGWVQHLQAAISSRSATF